MLGLGLHLQARSTQFYVMSFPPTQNLITFHLRFGSKYNVNATNILRLI